MSVQFVIQRLAKVSARKGSQALMLAKVTKETRRDQLLHCAKAMFAEQGYHATNVADIIAAAGVARGTFYLYFESKRQIFDAIVDGLLHDIDQRIAVIELGPNAHPPIEQLRTNLRRVLTLILEDRHLVQILLFQAVGLDHDCQRKLDHFYQSVRDQIEAALRMGMLMGLVRSCEARLAAAAILGAIQGVVALAARPEPPHQPGVAVEPMIDQILGLGLYGLLELPHP